MATHSSVLAWRIPGTGEPGGLPSMGSHRVRHDWSDLAAAAAAADSWSENVLSWAQPVLRAAILEGFLLAQQLESVIYFSKLISSLWSCANAELVSRCSWTQLVSKFCALPEKRPITTNENSIFAKSFLKLNSVKKLQTYFWNIIIYLMRWKYPQRIIWNSFQIFASLFFITPEHSMNA